MEPRSLSMPYLVRRRSLPDDSVLAVSIDVEDEVECSILGDYIVAVGSGEDRSRPGPCRSRAGAEIPEGTVLEQAVHSPRPDEDHAFLVGRHALDDVPRLYGVDRLKSTGSIQAHLGQLVVVDEKGVLVQAAQAGHLARVVRQALVKTVYVPVSGFTAWSQLFWRTISRLSDWEADIRWVFL